MNQTGAPYDTPRSGDGRNDDGEREYHIAPAVLTLAAADGTHSKWMSAAGGSRNDDGEREYHIAPAVLTLAAADGTHTSGVMQKDAEGTM